MSNTAESVQYRQLRVSSPPGPQLAEPANTSPKRSSMASAADGAAAQERQPDQPQPHMPQDASDGMTEPVPNVQRPPGMEGDNEGDEAMPAAPEDPQEAEASAGAEQATNSEEVAQRLTEERNRAIDEVIRSTAASHNRQLKRRTSESAAAEARGETVQTPSSDWLRAAMANSLKVFGDHIDAKFATMEARHNELHWHMQGTLTRVEALEQNSTEQMENTQKNIYRHDEALQRLTNATAKAGDMAQRAHSRLNDIERYLKNMTDQPRPAEDPQQQQQQQRQAPQHHQQQREVRRNDHHGHDHAHERPAANHNSKRDEEETNPRLARIGNLGWDTESTLLYNRVKELFDEAKIDWGSIEGIEPVTGRDGRGSSAECLFTTEAALQSAKFKVRQLRKTFHDHKAAWLDRKKSRQELAPARAIHKCYDIVVDIEARRPDSGRVEKNPGSKLLFVNGARAFFTLGGQLRPTHVATSRYSPEELQSIVEYASAD